METMRALADDPTVVQSLVDAGSVQDREVVCAVQRGLASGANDVVTFSRFESAIVYFHQTLTALLDAAGPRP